MATPGPTTQRYTEQWAGSLLLQARQRRGWTQRQLAAEAGVPTSTVARIESGARQPSLVTLSRLFAAADLELRIQVADYDDHDDVLDARYASFSPDQRAAYDTATERTHQLLAVSRRRSSE